MGCGGSRDKGPPEHTQKWEYITLSEFKSTSAWNVPAYVWLWILSLTTVAVYAVDTMTAVNLLAFDRWSSEIKPTIPLKYSKWIFAGCILLSWALCIYECVRAMQVIKRGGVAECYMDPLAVSLQSMRGSGWRRFLVFSELTKSKKGADYIALFVYFQFKGAIRIILAEGPRQAVNAMSLYAVMNAQLISHHATKVSGFEQFWINLGEMTNTNKMQAIIFFSMLFTLVIWVISALSLIFAALCYLLFLWHYIPQSDGRLSIYCRRKIDRRLEKIVQRKIKAANEEEARNRVKYAKKIEALQMKKEGTAESLPLPPPKLNRAPTLPQIGDSPDLKQEEPKVGITRQGTASSMATLPQYPGRPGMPNNGGSGQSIHSDQDDFRPGPLQRVGTQASMMSYASDAPLLANAGFGGGEYRGAPAPGPPPPPGYGRNGPMRGRMDSQGTIMSQQSYTSGPSRYDTLGPGPYRNGTPVDPRMNGGPRYGTPGSNLPFMQSPVQMEGPTQDMPPMSNGPPSNAMSGFDFGIPSASSDPITERQPTPAASVYKPLRLPPTTTWQKAYTESPIERQPTLPFLDDHAPQSSTLRQSAVQTNARPEPSRTPSPTESYEMQTRPQHSSGDSIAPTVASSYVAFKPAQSVAHPVPAAEVAPSVPSLKVGRVSPTRSISPMSATSTDKGDYFTHVHVSSSLNPPEHGDNRLTVLGYSDIFDEYGTDRASTPGSQHRSRAPSPAQGPIVKP